MAQTVLGAVGAGIGFLWGGPTGAQYGWMVGSAIGGAIDPQVIPGPRIGEIAQQTSQEGVPRPMVWALSPPLTGNIIATGDPVIVRRRESAGKGGPKVETESVYRTYAIGVCEGPIGGFVRVWRNGILVYDVSSGALLTAEENSLFLEKARFFLGSFEQEPSPDLEVLFGIGTTPAHQGTAYMVIADEHLTDMRGAIPQYVFQVARGFSAGCELDAENLASVDAWSGPAGSGDISSVELIDGRIFEQTFSFKSGNIELINTAVGAENFFTRWVREWDLEGNQLSSTSTLHAQFANAGSNTDAVVVQNSYTLGATRRGFTDAHWLIDGDVADEIFPPIGDNSRFSIGSENAQVSVMHLIPDVAVYVANGVHVGEHEGKWVTKYPLVNGSPTGTPSDYIVVQTTGITDGGHGIIGHDSAGRVYVWRGGGMDENGGLANILRLAGDLSEILDTWVLPDLPWSPDSFRVFCGRYLVAGRSTQDVLIYDLENDLELLETLDLDVTQGSASPRFVGGSMLYFRAAADLWNITSGSDGGTYPLAEVVKELCARAGLEASKIDVSGLTQDVRGFAATNTYPCTGALQALSQVFLFDPSNYDGVIHFVPRGGDAVVTITEDDMLVDDGQESKRGDAIAVPRVLRLIYHDVAGGLAPDMQTSERS